MGNIFNQRYREQLGQATPVKEAAHRATLRWKLLVRLALLDWDVV